MTRVLLDANGLKGGEEPAKLDVGRFPVRLERGIFHPRNVFALVEADEPDEEGRRPRKLLAACLSANLTQGGWWRNLEAAHIEEIQEGDQTFLADDLRPFLKWLREQPATQAPQKALDEIRAFLDKRANRFETATRRSRDGMLQPRFYWGRSDDGTTESVVQFLKRTTKRELQGWRMEIVSPYFDEAEECEPLTELIAAFEPGEIWLFLPRDGDGKGGRRPAPLGRRRRGGFVGPLPEGRPGNGEGVEVFRVEGLPSREWTALPADDSRALAERLKSTSIFEVTGEDADGKPGLLLVQEIGMFKKPSLAPERTEADILKDWAARSSTGTGRR